MSHFIRPADRAAHRDLPHKRLAVQVTATPGELSVVGIGGILPAGAPLAKLPDRVKVIGRDGGEIRPSEGRAFYVTIETIDPYHLVVELEDEA